MQTRILKVPDVSCGHCERTIKKALYPLPGLAQVEVEITRRQVKVEFDESLLDVRTVGEALEKAGYPVEWEDVKPLTRKGGGCCCC
ncbi:MAG: heavy-metal-associated domain-containing protein [Fibrobacteria bacterium]